MARLSLLWKESGITPRQMPSISKRKINFFSLYSAVERRGGFLSVDANSEGKRSKWRDIIVDLFEEEIAGNNPKRLKDYYLKFLMPFVAHLSSEDEKSKDDKKSEDCGRREKKSRKIAFFLNGSLMMT